MSLDDFRIWAMLFLSLGGFVWTILAYRLTARKAEMDAQRDRLEAAEKRVTILEGQVLHLPTQNEFHELKVSQTAVEGEIKSLTKTLQSLERSSQRVEDFLLHDNRRAG